jgi:hypothetical protein
MLKKVVALTLAALIAASVLSMAGVGKPVGVARAAVPNQHYTHTMVSEQMKVLISTTQNRNIVERWYDLYYVMHCTGCGYVQRRLYTGRTVVRSLH